MPQLIGRHLSYEDTKNRGQALERIVAEILGYNTKNGSLVGGYPDIPNQLLEVKVQDAQTVDLGKYSPLYVEEINADIKATTEDVRYLIALTNSQTNVIEGAILVPGKELINIGSYVSETSYKCQRSIPMSFFSKFKGRAVFNP